MVKKKIYILLVVIVLVFTMPACNTSSPMAEATVATTQTLAANLPESEAAVPRVPVAEAKAAFDSGSAIIVDVRGSEAYAAGHVPGALNIQLEEFETNPANLKLDKGQWIITYCT